MAEGNSEFQIVIREVIDQAAHAKVVAQLKQTAQLPAVIQKASLGVMGSRGVPAIRTVGMGSLPGDELGRSLVPFSGGGWSRGGGGKGTGGGIFGNAGEEDASFRIDLGNAEKLKVAMGGIATGGKQAQGVMGQMLGAMKRALIVAPVWMVVRAAIQGVTSALQALPAAAIAWETQMAQIRRVGKGTAGDYAILSNSLLDLTVAYGVSTDKIGQGAALWAQQGKSISEIIPLMDTTIKMSLITGKSVSASVEDITAVMKSYGVTVNETSSVLDKIVKVEQEHAITAEVLTDAMKKGGPVAAQFGVSMEKFLGIVTATHVATRASGSEIGNAWKTIFARMATSAIPAIQTIAKVPVYMKDTGEATTTNTGIFRNFGDVLDEVMISMTALSETERVKVSDALAMKRTINYLLSAYQNWGEGIKATIATLDSLGTADKAVNILLGTTAQKTAQLQSAWGQLGVSLVDNGEFIKDTIDLLKEMTVWLNRVAVATKEGGVDVLVNKKLQEDTKNKIKALAEEETRIKSVATLKTGLSNITAFIARVEAGSLDDAQKKKIIDQVTGYQVDIQSALDKQPINLKSEMNIAISKRALTDRQKAYDDLAALSTQAPSKYYISDSFYQRSIQNLQSEVKIRQKSLSTMEKSRGFRGEIAKQQLEDEKKTIDYLEKIITLKNKISSYGTDEYYAETAKNIENERKAKQAMDEYNKSDKSLTLQQLEEIANERELIVLKNQVGVEQEEIIKKQIEQIKNSQSYNTEKEKTLALSKAENDLLDAQLKNQVEGAKKLEDMALRGEGLKGKEKEANTKLAKMQMMTPSELAIQYSGENKELINKNIGLFDEKQKQEIVKQTDLWRQLSGSLPSGSGKGTDGPYANASGAYGKNEDIGSAKIPSPNSLPTTLNNTYNIPITLTGAITNDDIARLTAELDVKIKAQKNYVGDLNLDTILDNATEAAKKKMANINANTKL